MPRVLIFLFDGTGNEPTDAVGSQPTNVFNINSLIAEHQPNKRRPRSQITFYVPGIGTKFYGRGFAGTFRELFFGDGLHEMIMRSYINLASNYRSGDRIVVIGFSRGAVAARLFCRLVTDFGLLRAASVRFFSDMFTTFWEAITDDYYAYTRIAQTCREKYQLQMSNAEPPDIDFLGMFDCVRGYKDTKHRNFLYVIDVNQSKKIRKYLHLMSLHDIRRHFELARLMPRPGAGREVWMPGVHSDVGGGYPADIVARVSLLTMAQALQTESGIALERDAVKKLRLAILSQLDDGIPTINSEGDAVSKRYRNTYFRKDDRVHYLHRHLSGRTVHWKTDGSVIYTNRLGRLMAIDRTTIKSIR